MAVNSVNPDNPNAQNRTGASTFAPANLTAPAGSTNPYPKGISVAGTGPNNTPSTWQTVWDPLTGTWGVESPGGLLPIYNASQFSQVVPKETPSGIAGTNSTVDALQKAYGTESLGGLVAGSPGLQYSGNGPGGSITSGSDLTGGSSAQYTLDPATGYYIPKSAFGFGANEDFTGALAPLALGAGLLGAGAAGVIPGVADVSSGAVAPEIGNFVPPPIDTTAINQAGNLAGTFPVSGLPDAASVAPEIANFVPPGIDTSAIQQAGAMAGNLPVAGVSDPISTMAASFGSPLAPSDSLQLASLGGPMSDVGGPSGLGGLSILPATGPADISTLSPDLASNLGIDTGSLDFTAPPISDFETTPANISNYTPPDIGSPSLVSPSAGAPLNIDQGSLWQQITSAAGGAGSSALKWAGKNPASTGLLGLSLANALKKPAIPPELNSVISGANKLNPQAQSTIQSGGTSAPQWSQQKSAIDAQIDQQVQQLSEQLMQAQINSGAGGGDSAVTQQKIAQLKSTLETQRQQLYMAAQAQNVGQAIQVMAGNNQALLASAQLQMQESQDSLQAAMQTAELALLLASGGGTSPTFKIG